MRTAFALLNMLFVLVAMPEICRAQAARVDIENGNVILSESGRKTVVTREGKDVDVSLSFDAIALVFIRVVDSSKTPGNFSPPRTELWIAKQAEQWMPKPLLARPIMQDAARFQDFRTPAFSPDGKLIYFLVMDYSTVSPALFWIGVDGTVKLVAQAQKYWVVNGGALNENVIVQQNRGLLSGVRVQMFYVFDPTGKEVGLFSLYEKPVLDFIDELARGRK